MKILVQNKKAYHDYLIEDQMVAGIILEGKEVKSIIGSSASFDGSYIDIINGEAYLVNCHVAHYDKSSSFITKDERRKRKLLLNKSELRKLSVKVKERGYTIVPLNFHYSDTKKIKVVIALCKGKKQYDKREDIKKRDLERERNRHE